MTFILGKTVSARLLKGRWKADREMKDCGFEVRQISGGLPDGMHVVSSGSPLGLSVFTASAFW
jgi:hypothetical protein